MSRWIKKGATLLAIGAICWITLELLLQLSFDSLPPFLRQRLPQAPIRYGIRFDTPHGAREYPAHEAVNITIGPYSGDLFSITCLSPSKAEAFPDYTVRYTRDTHGFRNPEPWPDDADLVIVGDSFTAAEAINRPFWMDITPSTLAFGLPGSGSLEQLKLLEAYGFNRQPEVVVMAYFGGNDLTDTWRFYQAEQLGENLYTMSNRNRYPWEYLATFQLLMFLRDALTSAPNIDDCHYPIALDNDILVAFYDEFLSLSTISKETLRASSIYRQTQAAIIEAAERTKAIGGVFILMYIPHKAEIYWDFLNESQQRGLGQHVKALTTSDTGLAERLDVENSAELIRQNRTAQRELLAELATEEAFLWLDLTPYLQKWAQDGHQPYFFADTHWNQSGHDFIRNILKTFLTQETAITP